MTLRVEIINQALQTGAQADIRQKYPHPFYWASFILIGQTGKLTSEKLAWLRLVS